jgi:hypothetical protein
VAVVTETLALWVVPGRNGAKAEEAMIRRCNTRQWEMALDEAMAIATRVSGASETKKNDRTIRIKLFQINLFELCVFSFSRVLSSFLVLPLKHILWNSHWVDGTRKTMNKS